LIIKLLEIIQFVYFYKKINILETKIKEIPVYGLDSFAKSNKSILAYQVNAFDVNRNFKVEYPHRHHDFYEVLFLTNGSGIHTIDFQDYKIKPYSIFFLSPGQIHDLQLSSDVTGYIFLFSSAFYHFNKTDPFKLFELPFFYNLGKENPPIYLENELDKSLITDFFIKSIAESGHNFEESEEVTRAFLDLLLIHCKRIYPIQNQEDGNVKGKILVKRFKQIIEQKCRKNLSIKQYAELLKITPNHLSETVKAITGRTSTDLINDRMLLEIKRMLKYTNLNISEIAYQLNFSDQSYFSKYFKKLVGMSPGGFRSK
jgi:AraC family transcriptional regulator, transcriptional activator of pobA